MSYLDEIEKDVPMCVGCEDTIEGPVVETDDGTYHPACEPKGNCLRCEKPMIETDLCQSCEDVVRPEPLETRQYDNARTWPR